MKKYVYIFLALVVLVGSNIVAFKMGTVRGRQTAIDTKLAPDLTAQGVVPPKIKTSIDVLLENNPWVSVENATTYENARVTMEKTDGEEIKKAITSGSDQPAVLELSKSLREKRDAELKLMRDQFGIKNVETPKFKDPKVIDPTLPVTNTTIAP